MKFIKLLWVIIRYNPFKFILLGSIIAMVSIAMNFDPHQKIKVNHYIRVSNESVYVQYDKTEELINNKSIYYKDGYAYYPDYGVPCTLILLSIIVGVIFFSMGFSYDEDYNFNIKGCRAQVRVNDVSITSVGNGEYVYLLDRKAIAITTSSTMNPETLRYYINCYISRPYMYHTYTTRDDIRLDTLKDIIELEL